MSPLTNLTTLSRRFLVWQPCHSVMSNLELTRRKFHVFRETTPLRQHRRNLLLAGQTVGLVPTMGALHDGHLSLVRQAAAENNCVIVTIYVNPTQFGIHEDLETYPRTWDSDLKRLRDLNSILKKEGRGQVDAIFAPTSNTMYPALAQDSVQRDTGSYVTITPLANLLEGKSRPDFFRGVATICTKLFNIVEPERVYLGQKDIQQTMVLKRMVKDFHINTHVCVVPTKREFDGLAMSSRNVYLGARRRKVGLVLHRALNAAAELYQKGARTRKELLDAADAVLKQEEELQDSLPSNERVRFEVDYISLADPTLLEELENIDNTEGAVLSGAIKIHPINDAQPGEILGLGKDTALVRLIDNVILKPVTQAQDAKR